MILILSLLFATPPTKRVEYAHVRAARDSALVIYAIDEVDHNPGDFEHHVFVALVRDGREIHRDDVTADLMTVDDNTFMTMAARVNRFNVGGNEFFDVVIETGISGTGGISECDDFFFRVDGEKLVRAGILKGTAAYGRGGVTFVSQTTSELLVSDQLVWVRRERKATAAEADESLVVHCRVTRTAYRVRDGM